MTMKSEGESGQTVFDLLSQVKGDRSPQLRRTERATLHKEAAKIPVPPLDLLKQVNMSQQGADHPLWLSCSSSAYCTHAIHILLQFAIETLWIQKAGLQDF
jgi:hypothetical protein